MRVWLYLRLSNDDDKEQNSLSNQRKILLEYAAQKGYTVVGESADDNASGMNFRRDGAAQIVKAAEAGQIDAVLVKDLSRLGRHKTQTALFIDCLRERNVRVLSAAEGIDTFDENDDLMIAVRGLLNDYYARDIGKKIRAGYRQKQRDGIVIIPPFGYWKNKNTQQIEIVDEAANTVRLIYSLYLAGRTLKSIAQELNTQQRRTPAQLQSELYGKRAPDRCLWSYTTVKRILCDESYAGTLHNHLRETVDGKQGPYLPAEERFRHEDFYPEIIPKADWLAVQEELSRRNAKKMPQGSNRPKHRYAGLLKCADCGAPFVPIIRWWNGKRRVEYICKTYMDHGKAKCPSHRIHEDTLDNAVTEALQELRDELCAQAQEKTQELKARASNKPMRDARISVLQGEIQSLDTDIEALLMERIQDKPHSEQYDSLIAKLAAEQELARQKLDNIKSSGAVLCREFRMLNKRIAELDKVLATSPLDETDMRRLIECIVLVQTVKEVCVSAKWKTAN